MPRKKKAPKLAEAFSCAKCDFVYRSPIPLVAVSHTCYANDPAGHRQAARPVKEATA